MLTFPDAGWLISAGRLRAPAFTQATAHVSIQDRLNVCIWRAKISVRNAQGHVLPRCPGGDLDVEEMSIHTSSGKRLHAMQQMQANACSSLAFP